jgi:GSPII_E N-terminal domain.
LHACRSTLEDPHLSRAGANLPALRRTISNKSLAKRTGRTPFETKLVEAGQATPEQFERAQKDSEENNIPFLKALENILGQPLTPDLARAYKKQQMFELRILYGIDSVDPDVDVTKFDIATISGLIDSNVVSMQICRECEILPLERTEAGITLGIVSPTSPKVIAAVDRLAATNPIIKRVMAQEDFDRVFDEVLNQQGYRARIRNHGHSCFLCEIVIRSQFHTTYEPEHKV